MSPHDPGALIDTATQLGIELSAPQAQLLLGHLALLAKWNRVYNLTAVREPEAMLAQHLLDSMAIIAPLRRWGANKIERLLDVGSGAGLPGVVIAILLPEVQVTCVDSVGKKASFICQAAVELGIKNLHAVHARVEQLCAPPFAAITARAFASLLDFTTLTRRHLGVGSIWLAMKAQYPAEEIAELPPEIEVFHVEQLSVPGLAAERCIVWMRMRA